MKFWLQRFRTPLAVAGVLALAALGFLALDHLLDEVHLHDVRAAWYALSPGQLLLSILLAVVSYLALTLYDVLALIAIRRPLPYRTAAFASFTSYTLSHNLGLSLLTGGSARYRVYSAAGLGVGDVARVVTIASGTYWGGVLTLAALMLAIAPKSISVFGMSPSALQVVALAMLALIVGFVLWLGKGGRHVRFRKLSLPLPGAPVALAQIGVAAVDLAAASAALFVLVPGVDVSTWPPFFMGYTLAIIAVLVTHVPGGIGIFEAVMLAALPSTNRPELVAALLAYRLIYYIAPLIVAIALVAFHEGRRWHAPLARTVRGMHIVTSGLSPTMIAALVFLGGSVLLVSGSLPAVPGRMITLYRFLPLPFVETSHMAASLVGAALLLLSAGLYRRLDGAFWLTRMLLLAGAGFSLLKGLDFEEASVMLAITALLQWTRPAFYRRTHLTSEALTPDWLATVAAALGLSIWIGFFAYKHVDYQADLWWRFAERGDASRFLRASFAVAVMMAAVAYSRLFRPAAPAPDPTGTSTQPTPQAIALAQHTNAQLAFTGDKRFLVSSTGQCFIMYQIRGHSWIVMGDPVGARPEWSDLLWRLREQADAAQGRLLLYQISAEALPFAVELGLQIVKYGEEARVDLTAFTLDGPAAKPLRYAERRALRDGATFEVVAAADVPVILGTLSDISTRWLQAKGHREKGFSVGRFDHAYMSRFDCALVRQGDRIVAFANIWAAEDKTELSVDLMRHEEDMPYGTMDFLFVRLMQWGQANDYRWFNLGVAPLSGLEARRLAPLWSKLGSLLYRHGESLYGFEGLRAYKDKFSPEWAPCFVAGPQGISFGRALIDLQALISAKVPN
ncbi:MAG: bifunctional lysylphosphatidylglycerol flippase/synthetase MprF [Sphingobium sp.]|uniref:bifunctional lysylphosphatidylglycerol flippase/synthetase MprF n=1 Tax=Sphingobium sp. TaxID=1912891 RepID=UPI0029BAC5C8|nr:bifunctional lysylphosphatidylglycerol flippase/synthetase MprF [Sphingobium sp.]MDX3911401.1 bifunctional lysylphosphatidylglycerol flippase/synthetase MprF [Sphingobium sp.]